MNKKQIRSKFRNEVFSRDNYTCRGCGLKTTEEFLDAHHIENRNSFPNGGYVKENGITLCKDKCHLKAEKWHQTNGKEWEEGFHPNQLFAKIGSSEEIARKKDSKNKSP